MSSRTQRALPGPGANNQNGFIVLTANVRSIRSEAKLEQFERALEKKRRTKMGTETAGMDTPTHTTGPPKDEMDRRLSKALWPAMEGSCTDQTMETKLIHSMLLYM